MRPRFSDDDDDDDYEVANIVGVVSVHWLLALWMPPPLVLCVSISIVRGMQ